MLKCARIGLKIGLLLVGLQFVCACSSTQLNDKARGTNDTAPPVPGDYDKLIDYWAAGDSEYNGLYNNFEYKALILNSPVRNAILAKEGSFYEWDAEKAQAEKEKVQKELSEETRVFMSFFTPDHNNDNLTNTKSIWRIYLDVGGHRYEGKVKRIRTLLAELQAIYPFHTRWTTSYEVTFPIAATAIETQPSVYTVTGPLGTRVVNFHAVR